MSSPCSFPGHGWPFLILVLAGTVWSGCDGGNPSNLEPDPSDPPPGDTVPVQGDTAVAGQVSGTVSTGEIGGTSVTAPHV